MIPAQLIQLSKYVYGDRKKADSVSSTPDRKSFSSISPIATSHTSSVVHSTGSAASVANNNPILKGAPVSSSTSSTASVVPAGMGSPSGTQPSSEKSNKKCLTLAQAWA